MNWDLGFQGLALLAAMSVAFGGAAHLIAARRTTPWLWAIAGTAFLLAGLFASEVLFGWATAAELAPNIDGLSFDEALLAGVVTGVASIVVTWRLASVQRNDEPASTSAIANGSSTQLR
jgi:membrane protein implicated in regulation of membrane protease activity